MEISTKPTHIIGGGLAGAEAAWQVAQHGIRVIIHEMRPVVPTPAHQTGHLAELVCSNSFRSDDKMNNAVGLLHEEMRQCKSLILRSGDMNQVPAGGALAVDRHNFSKEVENKLEKHPFIKIDRNEVKQIPVDEWGTTIIATGP